MTNNKETKTLTMIENLCIVARCQGGTIHQYCDLLSDNFLKFKEEWKKVYEMSGALTTKMQFVAIAAHANYEGLIWRASKVEEHRLLTFTPEAREIYIKSRRGDL